jgi:hypothetical protein
MHFPTANSELDRIKLPVPDPTCASRTRRDLSRPLLQPPYHSVRATFLVPCLTSFPFRSKDHRCRDMWVFDATLHKGMHLSCNVVCD